MAYRFKLAEPFEDGCRRIAREQIERAQRELGAAGDASVAVHETRKCLKRLRALLRLVRPALGESAFHQENAHLRGIARLLSGARDRHVLLETVAKLEAASHRKGLVPAVREALDKANGEAASGEHGPAVEAAAAKQALKRLGEAKRRLARLELSGSGFEVVGPGLEASYRKARRAFHAAYAELTDEAVHEWRKGAQQHWRHMVLLSRAWPGYLNARIAEARKLSQILGDDHDLALLAAFVRSEPGARIGQERAGLLEGLARRRQQELRAIAHPTGLRLFAEGAGALRRKVATYWEAAVALREHEPEEGEDEAREPKRRSRAPARRRSTAA